MGSRRVLWSLSFAFILCPAIAAAQGTGTIRGRVTETSTGAPVVSAQIRVEGTTLGALTGSDGTYTITGVPAGAQFISNRRVGFATERAAVYAASDEYVQLDYV